MINQRMHNQRGVALVIVFLIMTIFSAAVLSVSILLINEIKVISANSDSAKSFYAAESSLERTLYLDRKQLGAGGVRGLCSICATANLTSCTYTNLTQGGGDGCDPATCNNCKVDFTAGFDNQTYSVTATVTPDTQNPLTSLLSVSGSGFYKNIVRHSYSNSTSTASVIPPGSTGTLRIVKNTVGGNGTFTYAVGGPSAYNPSISTASNTGSSVTPVNPGTTYSITENVPSGWIFNSVSCDGGVLGNPVNIVKNTPLTAVNDTSIGSATWSAPTNALTENSINASAFIAGIGQTNYLKVTNFGFNIPATATINGITVSWKKGISNENGGQDNSVRLVKGGTIVGNDKSVGQWPMFSTSYIDHGTSSDLWGVTWTPADINASNFGAVISGKRVAVSRGSTFNVDAVRITINYSPLNPNGTQSGTGITGVTVTENQTTTCTFQNTAAPTPSPSPSNQPVPTPLTTQYIYVGSSNNTSFLQKYNASNLSLVQQITTNRVIGLATSLNGANIYMSATTNSGSGSFLRKYNTSDLSLTNTATTGSGTVAVSADGNYVYVAGYSNRTLSKFNASNLSLITSVTPNNGPRIASTPVGNYIYVISILNTLQKYNASDLSLVQTVSTGNSPASVAASFDGNYIYVVTNNDQTIQKFSAHNLSLLSTVNIGGQGQDIVISPNGNVIYVSSFTNQFIKSYNTSNLSLINSVSLSTAPSNMSISDDGNFLYIIFPTSIGSTSTIKKYSTSNLSLVTSVITNIANPSDVCAAP